MFMEYNGRIKMTYVYVNSKIMMKDKIINFIYLYHLTISIVYHSQDISSIFISCDLVHQNIKYHYILQEYAYGV